MWVAAAIVAVLAVFFVSEIITSFPAQVSINQALSTKYQNKTIEIKGSPVLISSLNTPYGYYPIYDLKDSSGQIHVEGITLGWEKAGDGTVTVAGILGDVCVSQAYNNSTGSVDCQKTALGLLIR